MLANGWSNAFDCDESIICLLDSDLKIVRCNPAWDQFALSNEGESAIAEKVIGASIMKFLPPVLRGFYETAYGNVRRFRREWWHVFECSSPVLQRHFHMRILPSGEGVLIINTLLRVSETDPEAVGNILDYSERDGMVTMCAHCRRVRNLHRNGGWDWVPQLIMRGTVLINYGICDFCEAYHRQADKRQLDRRAECAGNTSRLWLH